MNALETVERLKQRFPNEPEYIQAVSQVLSTIEEEYNRHPEFDRANLIERLCIPDRIISFRVTWVDDKGNVQTNMGYRIQHNNAIGPYKGGIRFHASVNPLLLAQMFIPLLIFFAVLFFVAQIVGRLMNFPKKDTVALNMTTLARNSPLSLAIAVVTFPAQPLVSLALVIGPLIELPVLSVISGILKRWNTEE